MFKLSLQVSGYANWFHPKRTSESRIGGATCFFLGLHPYPRLQNGPDKVGGLYVPFPRCERLALLYSEGIQPPPQLGDPPDKRW